MAEFETQDSSEHVCHLADPEQFDRFARKNGEERSGGKGIDVIYGRRGGKSRIQSLRYKNTIWDAEAARKHCRGRGGSFEAAREERSMRTVLVKSAASDDYDVQELDSDGLAKLFRANCDKDGNVGAEIVLFGSVELKKAGEEGAYEWIMSDFSLDRDRERIDPAGWDLKAYKKNPVVLWAHMSWTPAIGKASSVRVHEGALKGKIHFDLGDPFAAMIAHKVESGFLSTGSVGYRALKVEFPGEDDGKGGKRPKDDARLIFRKQELWEYSICNIPANANAQVLRSAKSAIRSPESMASLMDLLSVHGSKGIETVAPEPVSDPEPEPEEAESPQEELSPEDEPSKTIEEAVGRLEKGIERVESLVASMSEKIGNIVAIASIPIEEPDPEPSSETDSTEDADKSAEGLDPDPETLEKMLFVKQPEAPESPDPIQDLFGATP